MSTCVGHDINQPMLRDAAGASHTINSEVLERLRRRLYYRTPIRRLTVSTILSKKIVRTRNERASQARKPVLLGCMGDMVFSFASIMNNRRTSLRF